MWTFSRSILSACAKVAARRPWWVLGLTLLLTVVTGYLSTRLTINTNTENFLSASLPFRQNEIAYSKAFPRERPAVIVIDGPSGDEAAAAARALGDRLTARTAQFTKVQVAGDNPFFEDNGLLFLPVERLQGLASQIRQAGPLVSVLQSDPSLRGLARVVGQVETAGAADAPPQIARLMSEMAKTTAARAEGRDATLNWSVLFDVGSDLLGKRRLVLATPVPDNHSLDRFGRALEALQADMKAVGAEHPGTTFRVTGDPALQQQELDDAFSGALYASGLSFILVALSLILGIRSGRLIWALLITLIIGSVWTTGLAAVAVGELNLISVAFMVLFFGLGVDFGTHIGLRYLEEVEQGGSVEEALKAAMMGEGPSITLSALCAALAFLSFVPTSYVALADFGIISALGMLVAVVITFTVQPALMAVMPPRPAKKSGAGIGIGLWLQRHYKAVLAVSAIVTLAAVAVAPRARIDVNPLNLQNPKAAPVLTYRDLASDPQTSPYALNVLAPNLEAARALAPRLRAVEGVAGVRSIESFIPADQDRKIAILSELMSGLTAAAPAERQPAPDDAALAAAFADLRRSSTALAGSPASEVQKAAQALSGALQQFASRQGTEPAALRSLEDGLVGGFAELSFGLGAKLSVSQPVTLESIPEDLRREWMTPEGAVRLLVMPAGDITGPDALNAFAERVKAVAPQAAGVPAILTGAGDAILSSFVEAIAYTTLAIAVVVAFMRRRLSDVLLVLAPLVVASIWTVAASALLDLAFNFANIIVVPLLIGLGVASSVHIVARARELSEEAGGSGGGGVMDTSTSLAVLVAQLNTVAAFATLAVSHHRGLYSMGMLLGLAILFVLIASLVVLPALLIALERRGAARQS
jgi:hopanoid biosynthesis associated RND transporter like protein HpnN